MIHSSHLGWTCALLPSPIFCMAGVCEVLCWNHIRDYYTVLNPYNLIYSQLTPLYCPAPASAPALYCTVLYCTKLYGRPSLNVHFNLVVNENKWDYEKVVPVIMMSSWSGNADIGRKTMGVLFFYFRPCTVLLKDHVIWNHSKFQQIMMLFLVPTGLNIHEFAGMRIFNLIYVGHAIKINRVAEKGVFYWPLCPALVQRKLRPHIRAHGVEQYTFSKVNMVPFDLITGLNHHINVMINSVPITNHLWDWICFSSSFPTLTSPSRPQAIIWSSYGLIQEYTHALLGPDDLTHWGRDKIDAISQTTFWSAFSWMKMFEFRLKFHWSLFLRVQLTIFQHWFS